MSRNNYYNRKEQEQQPQQQQPRGELKININPSGYRQYYDENSESWKYTHRTVGERKIGRELYPNEHVHHINKDKTDNRYSNLVVLKDNIHREVHKSSYNESNCCFRCGRDSHWSSSCYASYDIDGNEL
ncbi:hypothetical protein ACTFIZ_008029 [Dictyostelium cf. discoideum]